MSSILDLLKLTSRDKMSGIWDSENEYKEWWENGKLYLHIKHKKRKIKFFYCWNLDGKPLELSKTEQEDMTKNKIRISKIIKRVKDGE